MSVSRGGFPNNLPVALSSFIGRGRDIEAVKRLLSATRLLTLTGPGGCGKTRLGLWVAAEVGPVFTEGAWLVELAPLTGLDLVPQSVAHVLGLREATDQPLIEMLTSYLRPRELLLVLDNCEHLVTACAYLAETLLRACPSLRILATSREALAIPGETVWPVPALSVPERAPHPSERASVPAMLQFEAVRLFVDRASAASPAFSLTDRNAAAVAQICQQLDGMPLAVELAAARVPALSVEQIATRLSTHERFRLLTEGRRTALPRQQTLAATLDWSHALLSTAERLALRRLAVFAGGWTLPAAEAVCAAGSLAPGDVLEALSGLVNKSLVVFDQAGEQTRYFFLEVIRQYAQEKLAEAGETEAARDRHLDYFVHWSEQAEPHLTTAEQLTWLRRYQAERDNLRTALEWSQCSGHGAQAGLRLAAASGRFWRLRGYLTEGRAHLTTALALAERNGPPEGTAHSRALFFAGGLAYLQSDYPAARALFEASLAAARRLGAAGREMEAEALDMLGEVATEEGDYATAPVLFEECLVIWRELRNKRGVAEALMQLGWADLRTGAYARAAQRLEESLVLAREVGGTTYSALALAGLGEAALRQGYDARAVELLEESLSLRREIGDKWGIGTALGTLAWVALRRGDYRQMRQLLAESLALRQEIGDRSGTAWCLEKLAEVATRQGLAGSPPAGRPRLRHAVRMFGAAAALRAPVRSVIDPADLPHYDRLLADLRAALGQSGFATAWAEGQALPLEQAVAEALAEPEVPLAGSASPAPSQKESYGGLTAREREVAVLVAQGKSNREIAEALVVGARTAETYISRILNKLGFSSRVQIATWAIETGLAHSSGLPAAQDPPG